MYYRIQGPDHLEAIFDEYRPQVWQYDEIEEDMMGRGIDRWTLEHYGLLYPLWHLELGVVHFGGACSHDMHHGGGQGGGRPGARGGHTQGGRNTARHANIDRSALTVTQMPTMEGSHPRAEGRGNTRHQPEWHQGPDEFHDEEEDQEDGGPWWSDDEAGPSSKHMDKHGQIHPTVIGPFGDEEEDDTSDAGSEYRSRYRPTELGTTTPAPAPKKSHKPGKSRATTTPGMAIDFNDIEEEDGDDEYRQQHTKATRNGTKHPRGTKKGTEAHSKPKKSTRAAETTKKGVAGGKQKPAEPRDRHPNEPLAAQKDNSAAMYASYSQHRLGYSPRYWRGFSNWPDYRDPPPCDGTCQGPTHPYTYQWLLEFLWADFGFTSIDQLEHIFSESQNAVPYAREMRMSMASHSPPITKEILEHFRLLRPETGGYDTDVYNGGATMDYYNTDPYHIGGPTAYHGTGPYHGRSVMDSYDIDPYAIQPTLLGSHMSPFQDPYSMNGGSQSHGGGHPGPRGHASSAEGGQHWGGQADDDDDGSNHPASIRVGESYKRYGERRRDQGRHGNNGGS
ncbi:MAG: hypothetical protein Q9191_006199 [Dirinaria sp. TL-2023a]